MCLICVRSRETCVLNPKLFIKTISVVFNYFIYTTERNIVNVYDNNTNDDCIVTKIIYLTMLTKLNFVVEYNLPIHVKQNKYFGKYYKTQTVYFYTYYLSCK